MFMFWEIRKGSNGGIYDFQSLLDSPDQQLEGKFSMPHTGVSLDSLWCLREALSPIITHMAKLQHPILKFVLL